MTATEHADLLPQIQAIVREAGALILGADVEKGVVEKSNHQDLVTRYDGAVQAFLQQRLLALAPEAGFLGEEDQPGALVRRQAMFVVDPIDGTTNFIKGYNHSAISVGLCDGGQMALGVVYNPYTDELFSARRGGGAFLNGAPLRLSPCPMEDAVSVMGTSPYYRELADLTFAIGRRLFDRNLDMRRSGSAALDLCDLAAGRIDCYFECLLSPWDLAAGSLIAQEAGAVVTDLVGGPLPFDRKSSLAAANPQCHGELLAIAKACGATR